MQPFDYIRNWWNERRFAHGKPDHWLVLWVFCDKRGWWRIQLRDYGSAAKRQTILITTGRGYKNYGTAEEVAERFKRGKFYPCHSQDKHGNHRLQYADGKTLKKVFNTSGPMWQSEEEVYEVIGMIERERKRVAVEGDPSSDKITCV